MRDSQRPRIRMSAPLFVAQVEATRVGPPFDESFFLPCCTLPPQQAVQASNQTTMKDQRRAVEGFLSLSWKPRLC